jgi:hypothetical protein
MLSRSCVRQALHMLRGPCPALLAATYSDSLTRSFVSTAPSPPTARRALAQAAKECEGALKVGADVTC